MTEGWSNICVTVACYVRRYSEWSHVKAFLHWRRDLESLSSYGCISELYIVDRAPYVETIVCPSVLGPLLAPVTKDRLMVFKFDVLLLSIGPRWLMPRMYCSHFGLLYYT